jgi:hypothetical protein
MEGAASLIGEVAGVELLAEDASVSSFGAPPDGCAASRADVTKSDADAKSKDRGGKLCWRIGKTSELLRPCCFDAVKVIPVSASPAEMRVRKDGTALRGDCRLVILKQRRP